MKIVSILLGVLCSICIHTSIVSAHSPHDVIDGLVLSPNYSEDNTLFIIIKNTWVLKSENGGYGWKHLSNGLDRQFILSSISISSSFKKDKTIFISSKGHGIYRSTNAGNSWEKKNEGLPNLQIDFVSISPTYSNNGIVYAVGAEGGLFIFSRDTQNWKNVISEEKKITSLAYTCKNNNWVVIVGDQNGYLYTLEPNGDLRVICKLGNSGSITSIGIANDQKFDNLFYAGTEKGIYIIKDGGKTVSELGNMLSDQYIKSIHISSRANDRTILITTWQEAIFQYSHKNMNWEKIGEGLTTHHQADSDEYKSPHFRNIAFSDNFKNDKTMFLAGFDGLFKSTDAGKKWIQLETLPVSIIKGFSISPSYQNKHSIGVTTYGGGAYLSEDSGATWSVRNMGLKATRLSDIVYSPNYKNDKKIFTASERFFYFFDHHKVKWDGLWLKDSSWQSRSYRLFVKLGISHVWLEDKIFKKKNMSRIWPNIIAISPNFKKDQIIFFGSRHRGFFRSTDGGINFKNIWSDVDNIDMKKVTSLKISPSFSSDKTLFAGIRWEGIYKSEDNGKTWKPKNKGIRFLKKNKSVVPPYYYLSISPNYINDKTMFLGTGTGLYKSANGGANWEVSTIVPNEKSVVINSVAISPNYQIDKTVIASVYGRGLFKSETGGATWKALAKNLIVENNSLEFISFSSSYNVDHTLWGASQEAIFKSEDKGNNWTQYFIPITRYEDKRDVIKYVGEWQTKKDENFSAGSVHYSDTYGSSASLTFIGTGIRWIGEKSDGLGIAKVFIDEQFKGYIDQFDLQRRRTIRLFEINNLDYGPHTIEVQSVDNKNKKSKGAGILIDCFDVILNKNTVLSEN